MYLIAKSKRVWYNKGMEKIEKITHKNFVKLSKNYIDSPNHNGGFAVLRNYDSRVLLSAPHGVGQTRLGKPKEAEIGSARMALMLHELTQSNLIIKTKNIFDDANFDIRSTYKDEIVYIIKQYGIKYLIDFHGIPADSECDINLGVNFGENIKNNEELYDQIMQKLTSNGFKVNVDNPFCGRYPSIAATFAQSYNIWTLQLEINCGITNDPEQIDKLNTLIATLKECVELCEKAK